MMKPRWGMIGFERYKVRCIIGTHEHERIHPQEIEIDLRVEANISAAAATDDLKNTINYIQLAELCEKTALEGHYHLLEAYAAATLDKISVTFNVKKAWMCVRKAKAITAADYALVELIQE
jgi:dihydroneopterin aldolase